jgi:hypothetical protein
MKNEEGEQEFELISELLETIVLLEMHLCLFATESKRVISSNEDRHRTHVVHSLAANLPHSLTTSIPTTNHTLGEYTARWRK